jgi:site-specific DNA recombinase
VRAVIYCRVSDPKQEREGTSLDTQEAACRAHVAEQGYALLGVYREVYTGAVFAERPQLGRVRDLIERHAVDRVVVHHSDRFGRDPDDRVFLRVEAKRKGVVYESVTDPMEDTDEGRLVDYIAGYAAKVERRQIRERAMRGTRARAEKGLLLAGPRPPYGYRFRPDTNKGALDVDPVTGPVVQRIFREVVEGRSLRKIAAGLSASGIPTPTGRRPNWDRSTIYTFMQDRRYTGEARALRFHAERTPHRHGRYVFQRDDEDTVLLPDGTIPALIDAETFAVAQERLKRNKVQSARRNSTPEAWLLRAGFAKCGYCGRNLRVARDHANKHPTYRCQTTGEANRECPTFSIYASVLDGAVWSRVTAILRDPPLIAREAARLQEHDPTAADLDVLDRGIAEVARRLANLTRRLSDVDDDGAAAPLMVELRALAARKRTLEAEREAVQGRRSAWEAARRQLAGVEEWCRRVAANLDAMTYAEKRLALEALGVGVKLYRKDHAPRWVITAAIPAEPGTTLSGTAVASPTAR